MDSVYIPDRRKWISPLTNLGESIRQLKELVRLRKESLVLIDPQPPANGRRRGLDSEMDGTAADDEDLHVTDDDEDIDAAAQRLTEILNKPLECKWSESDAACEAAVAAMGGQDFFESEEKLLKKKKKLERLARLAKSKSKTSRKRKVTRGRKKNVDEEEDIDSEMDVDVEEDGVMEDEHCSSTRVTRSSAPSQSTAIPERDVDSALYEEYNYNEDEEKTECPERPDDPNSQEEINDHSDKEEEELKNLVKEIPLALDESDDGEDFSFLDQHDQIDDFTNSSERHEVYKLRYKELLPSDSDVSDEEKERHTRVTFSDEENDQGNVNAGALVLIKEEASPPSPVPGPSTSTAAPATVSGSPKQRKKRGRRKKYEKKPRLDVVKKVIFEEDQFESDTDAVPNDSVSHVDAGMSNLVINNETSDNKDPIADFKRFTEWVFERGQKTEKNLEARNAPGLMKHLERKESEIKRLQRLTSSSRTTSKGEVFQDDPVMKSSSMPLLAPPLDPSASTTLQGLAIFITHGEDPSSFPWKSINVQQQINDDFAYDEFVKRMEQQKIDLQNPAMINKVVNKEDDFLVQILIYQCTDPEDVLPDEIKLRRRDEEAEISMAGGNGKCGKSRGNPANEDSCGNNSGGLNRYVEPRLAYELHMLGSQTVGDLMGAIHCENDYIYMQDVPHPSSYKNDPEQYAKNKFPASLLLIDNKIYVDPTKTHEADYVSLLNDWTKRSPKKNLGPFQHGNFNAKLKDLDVRFGCPYAYIHYEGCEHVFVFTKTRLLHTEDEHLVENYPKIVGLTKFKNIYCRVDNEYLARWAVIDFKEFPENPMLLCTECVTMYCYDKHKQKRGDFKLYPLIQIANLL